MLYLKKKVHYQEPVKSKEKKKKEKKLKKDFICNSTLNNLDSTELPCTLSV